MSRDAVWIPQGQPVVVGGHSIASGQIYVGHRLRSTVGTVEPALINPSLPVDPVDPSGQMHDLGPAPSYHLISSAHRSGYLGWLAEGAVRVEVPIGFVVLFFSGLERRVLVDAPGDPSVRDELPAIAAQVRRLRSAHGPASPRFDSTAAAFLDVLNLLAAARWPGPDGPVGLLGPIAAPPVPADDRWPVPVSLRVALAQFALSGTPVPPQWARVWAWYHPSMFPKTPQTRCAREFDTLFAVRYRQRLPAGLLPVPSDRPPIRVGYQPANPGMDTVVVERPDLPEVLEEPTSTRQLGTLVDSVTDALTPYSRWLARTPGGRGSVASTVLLPDDLLDHDPGPLRPLLNWANARLNGSPSAVVKGLDFRGFWSTADPAKMSREESESLAVVLARVGLGVEPDVRFAGPALGPGPVVLFRLDPQSGDRPSPGFLAAATMLGVAAATVLEAATVHEAATVLEEGGSPTAQPDRAPDLDDTVNMTITALAAELQLTVSERARLCARLGWLLAAGVDAARLRRQAQSLTPAEADAAGHFLVSVALSSPPISAAMVSALTSAYRLIGVDPELLYRRLHQTLAAGAPPPAESASRSATDVVVVRRARAGSSSGHALPRVPPDVRPRPMHPSRSVPVPSSPALGVAPVTLRPAVLTRRLAETESVNALLTGIFSDDEPDAGAGAQPRPEPGSGEPGSVEPGSVEPGVPADGARPAALDGRHRGFGRELATRSSWSAAELAALSARHGVLPSGALDVINEAAIELIGEPAIEGDDELTVNADVLKEIIS